MKRKHDPLSICLVLTCWVSSLHANPTGGSVAGGSAQIGGGPGLVQITQTSQSAIINWQSFSIASGETTRFVQPNASSRALNRVLGGGMSVIDGSLQANGQIYLINQNGILIGAGGSINTAAFCASTRDISDADFSGGNFHFVGHSDGGVTNLGSINASLGDVVLLGKTVDNEGTIHAAGVAGLVAADDILLAQKNADGSTITVTASAQATSAPGRTGVRNGGKIVASQAELKAVNGNLYALAIENTGNVRATGMAKKGGQIYLTSDTGVVDNAGTLDASSTAPGGQGGHVTVKSKSGLARNSGTILARGGEGGIGGFLDLSGHSIQFSGLVDTRATNGQTGQFLIDPDTLEIVASGGTGTIGSLPGTGDSSINASDLSALLITTDVVLQANIAISVNAGFDVSTNALTFNTPTVNLNAIITTSNNGTFSGENIPSGTPNTVNVGAGGSVQNGVDIATDQGTVNLAAATTYNPAVEVLINKNLTLNGNGAAISGAAIPDISAAHTVLAIQGSARGATVVLNNLTLENGTGTNDPVFHNYGGGLYVSAAGGTSANVTLNNGLVTGNYAFGDGGGIDVQGRGGTTILTLNNSTVSANTAINTGAGIAIEAISGAAQLILNNSTITANNDQGSGSGLANRGALATASITGSTISSNISSNSPYSTGGYAGAGIDNYGTLTIVNSTIANNIVIGNNPAGYAAIRNAGTATILESTITGNSTTQAAAGGAIGGGGFITIGNSILAANTVGGAENDISNSAFNDLGHNLVGQNGNAGGFFGTGAGNIVLQSSINTVLGGLANNGGPTQTEALLANSIASGAGSATILGYQNTDQRGMARSNPPSIGAFDLPYQPPTQPGQSNSNGTTSNSNLQTASLLTPLYNFNVSSNNQRVIDQGGQSPPPLVLGNLLDNGLVDVDTGDNRFLGNFSLNDALIAKKASDLLQLDSMENGSPVNIHTHRKLWASNTGLSKTALPGQPNLLFNHLANPTVYDPALLHLFQQQSRELNSLSRAAFHP